MRCTHLFYSQNSFDNNKKQIQENDNVVFMYYVDLEYVINENSIMKYCVTYSFKDKKSLINALCAAVKNKNEKLFYYY